MSLGLFWPNHWLVSLSSLGLFHAVLIIEASKYILVSTEQSLFFLLKNLLFTKSVIRMKNKCTWVKQPKKFLKVYGLEKMAASKGLPPARPAQSCCCPRLSTPRAPAAPPHPASAGDPPVSGGDTTVIPLNWELELPLKHFRFGAFLVAQWVRIHLPMQGAQAPPLIREDPTRHTATTPLHRSHAAAVQAPGAETVEPARSRACAVLWETPPQWEARGPQLESGPAHPARESRLAAVRTQCGQK